MKIRDIVQVSSLLVDIRLGAKSHRDIHLSGQAIDILRNHLSLRSMRELSDYFGISLNTYFHSDGLRYALTGEKGIPYSSEIKWMKFKNLNI